MSAPSSDAAGIRQVIRALVKAGYALDSVDDRGDEPEPVRNETEALEAITAVDDAFLIVTREGEKSWVRFVLGNDPEEVVCNHTTDLEHVLDPLTRSWW